MNEPGQIRYLRYDEIDLGKWDNCIQNSVNRLPYAFSWYLDRMAGTWDALVMGDYLYVMPLPTGRKYGISYLLQPLFIQQLGIFSPFEISPELVAVFLEKIPARYRLVRINLNTSNYPSGKSFAPEKKVNYQLDLSLSYPKLYKAYSENTRRNLKKAQRSGLQVQQIHNIPEFIQFVRNFLEDRSSEIKGFHFRRLQLLISYAVSNGKGIMAGVYSATNSLCAVVFLVHSTGRYIYLAAASNKEGIESRAMFFLVDYYIKKNAGRMEILDFEGSNIGGIARFYSGFGAKPYFYFTVGRNRLPWPLKVFKK